MTSSQIKSFQQAYARLLGPQALSGAQGLADALAGAPASALVALDTALQDAGLGEWLQSRRPANQSTDAWYSDDDEPMRLGAQEIATGEDYLRSMLSSAGVPAAEWFDAETVIGEVTRVSVKKSPNGPFASVTLQIDVPEESVAKWQAVRQVQPIEPENYQDQLGSAES